MSAAESAWIVGSDNIEAWELEEFLEDILNAEFNLVRDAGNDGIDLSSVSVCVLLEFLSTVVLFAMCATASSSVVRHLEYLNQWQLSLFLLQFPANQISWVSD